MRRRITQWLPRFVAVVLALTGLAVILGLILTSTSYRDGIAEAMWTIGFIAVLVAPVSYGVSCRRGGSTSPRSVTSPVEAADVESARGRRRRDCKRHDHLHALIRGQ